ncbi:hypothetical protein [Actinomadura chokoriensis]|uniref:Uncharacterized protein n=1 Tax=Actinomadura chokoriensis TaxID=454156 RepID=A0ABV4QP09_9ACTN
MAVLMGLSGLYAAVAAVNAVVIAGAERGTESAVARVTGLSRAQVVRMALIESAAVTRALRDEALADGSGHRPRVTRARRFQSSDGVLAWPRGR